MDEGAIDEEALNEAGRRWLDAQLNPPERFKIRSDETWASVRRGWEAGETGASLARRYDVGLDNLWRRRASEGWERRERPDPVPEPQEGWRRHAELKEQAFEQGRADARAVAVKLAEAMQGAPLNGVPLWHVGFVLGWRAEHLGAETARADREWARQADWLETFWRADGGLKPLDLLDRLTRDHNAAARREDLGLPEGVEAF